MAYDYVSQISGLIGQLLIALIALIFASYLVYADAKRQGDKDARGWAIGVLLFAIVVVPLYVIFRVLGKDIRHSEKMLVKDTLTSSGETPIRTKTTKFCRYCGSKIPRTSKYCEECGRSLLDE
ncbi:MAG: zinc ribbon domain-containing protein [Candidatus Bathyarchaeia archaeon]